MPAKFILKFDGESRGNPGHAGAGAFLWEMQGSHPDCIWFDSEYLGTKTNNQSEYSALILGLKECVRRQLKNLEICGDSQLVIRQLSGEYQVKHKKLIPLYNEAKKLIESLTDAPSLRWIPREENADADALANRIVDMELNPKDYEEDEDDEQDEAEREMEERSECFGFTRNEFEVLLSYGMRPWKHDYARCWDFVQAYFSGEENAEGEPTYLQFL